MNLRDSVLVALPAVLVGSCLGYLAATALDDSPQALASAPGRAAAAPSPELRGVQHTPLVPAAPDGARAPVEELEVDMAPRVPEAELERAVTGARAPEVEPEEGSGRITGEVLDEAGAPIEGATIVARRLRRDRTSDPSRVGAGPPDEPSLEEALREHARSWAESRAGRRRTSTGPDGGFVLDGLHADSSYAVNAYLVGHELEAEGRAYSISPGQRVTFRAKRVYEIPVELVHADGTEVAEGVVGVERDDDEAFYTWSREEPRVRLTPGRVEIRGYAGVRKTSYSGEELDAAHASEEVGVDVESQAGAPLRLVLAPRTGIRGRVVDELGTSGRRMVLLAPVAEGAEADLDALSRSDRRTWLRGGDRFHFLDLAPGTYAVGLGDWNQEPIAHRTVAVESGVTEVELVVPAPDPDRHVLVRAFGPGGVPLEDLDFRWRSRHDGGSRSGSIEGRRGKDGAWWLRPEADFFEPWSSDTSYTLTIQHSELGDRAIELEEGQREVTQHFEEPVSIEVVVTGYRGSSHEGDLSVAVARVEERGEDEAPWVMGRGGPSSRESLSPSGVARFDGLAPGTWRVDLQVRTDRWQGRTVQSVEVRATAGEERVSLSVPALYELVVSAPGLSEGTSLRLLEDSDDGERSPFAFGSNEEVGSDGRVVFEGLPAGRYTLTGSGLTEPVEVTVPCGEVVLDAREPDCLRVTIGDPEGALYQAGLRAGDLVIGVDGEEFDSVPNAWTLLRGEGEASLIVLRDGKRLEVTLQRPAMGSDWISQLGGMLVAHSR